MKFSEFISQHPDFDRGNENHGAMLRLADDSYIIIVKSCHEYAAPPDDATVVDAARYNNPDDTEEDCIAWAPGIACEALSAWVNEQERIQVFARYERKAALSCISPSERQVVYSSYSNPKMSDVRRYATCQEAMIAIETWLILPDGHNAAQWSLGNQGTKP